MKRKNRDTPGRRIAQAIIAQYKPKSVAEMQAALKEVFDPMFEAMLNGEMESQNNATVRNVTAEDFTNFSDGTILLDKYVVTDRLPVTSGEANIYVCEYDDEEYIAKIYNRKDAVKSEIVEKLKALDSPHVAKIYDTG